MRLVQRKTALRYRDFTAPQTAIANDAAPQNNEPAEAGPMQFGKNGRAGRVEGQ
jgi:hypothetical protein